LPCSGRLNSRAPSLRRKYRSLDYMSDALVESYGLTLEEAFGNAALAMTAVMTDLRRLSDRGIVRTAKVEGFDLESLLYNWLEAVLVRKDTDHELFRRYQVRIVKSGRRYTLDGVMRGGVVSPRRGAIKRDVKAVTYHEMSITRKDGSYSLRFLLDL
jgi:SHS2 domain-containing protein